MLQPFEFLSPGRIVFGRGCSDRMIPAAAGFGRRALVVVGRDPSRHAARLEGLAQAGLSFEVLSVPVEPTIELVRRGVSLARAAAVEVVVGLGGGSALDAAKAVAVLVPQRGDVLDYLEVIGGGQGLEDKGLPVIAIPTTAGTGTEVTRNAVLASPEHRVKASLRSPRLVPRLALVDPDLSSTMPPPVTAGTGVDALTQLIEPFVSLRAGPLTDGLCREGLRLAARSLARAVRDGGDAARDDMALAATLSGLALANAGLGIVHGLAGPVGGMVPAPHGAICGALLAAGMDVNLRALRTRDPESAVLGRFDEIGRLLTGRESARADDGVRWVADLTSEIGIPPLSTYGLEQAMVPEVIERALVASSTRTNPVRLTSEELAEIVERSL